MRKQKKAITITSALMLVSLSSSLGFNPLPEIKPEDIYRAARLEIYAITNDLAVERHGKPWRFSNTDRCNFTYFSPEVKGMVVDENGLKFSIKDAKAILGWGNYDNRQTKTDRIMMYSGWNEIEMEVRQSAANSVWKIELWANGSNKVATYGPESIYHWMKPAQELSVSGTNWQTVRFRVYKAGADGFGLQISGAPENTVEIKSLRITQTISRGYYRKNFDLPKGKIWRAVGQITIGMKLFVNGEAVDVKSVHEATAPVNLAPYLKPGTRNVIALYAEQGRTDREPPSVYFQGKVIMADGTVVSLDTDTSWRGSTKEFSGWQNAEYDDSNWLPARTGSMDLSFAARRWPAYDGRLLLENAGTDPLLYFSDDAPIKINLRVPEGLARDGVTAHWILRKVERDADRPEVARGEILQSKAWQDDSAVFLLDLGQQPMGVYTIEAELRAQGRMLERRLEEPIIVVGKLPMQEVVGDEYEEGMRLELEDVIDFTDPNDPHRWVEAVGPKPGEKIAGVTKPRIVRKDKLVYREVTDDGRAAMFSYRFEFARPYNWYLLVLEYPNDAERWIGVSVTSAGREIGTPPLAPWRRLSDGWTSEDGPSLVTGLKYPLDNRLHEMRWLHWADPEIHTLDIVNLKRGLRAAAARLRVYRVLELPAMKVNTSGERFFGIHTERARSLGRTFADVDGLFPYQGRYDKLGYDLVARFVQRLRWHFDACKNYTEYLRFTGQNLHVMGAFQYNEGNTPYIVPDGMPGDGRLLQDIRETALRFFERNGITMYSMVEYVGHRSLKAQYAAGDAEVAAGANTICFVDKNGKQGGWHLNPNHPAVEAGYLQVADDLAKKFSFSPAWKGVYYCVFIDGGGIGPAPCVLSKAVFDYDYSDATIAAFERDTGIKIPVEQGDQKRFEKRYLFLTSDPMLEKWIAWRGQATRSYMTKTLQCLHKYRPDLNVLYGFHSGSGMCRYWLYESGKPYAQYFREMGMDPTLVKNHKNIWFGRYIYPVGPASDGAAFFWEHIVGAEPLTYYDVGPNRMVVLGTCWHELPTGAPGWLFPAKSDSTHGGSGRIEDIPEGWPMPANISRFISQAHGDNVKEPFTQTMIGADPDILIFGFTDVNIINSREQEVREIAKVVTALPKEKFLPVLGTTDFKHNLAIRALHKGADYWFYVANPGYWPVEGTVTLKNAAHIVRANDGRTVETTSAGGKTIVPISLRPYGIVAFRAAGQDVEIETWEIAPLSEEHLAHMRGIIRDVRALLEVPEMALAITRDDRDFMRSVMDRAEALLQKGEYAAAWSELTNWRFFGLWRENLVPAQNFSARLADRPAIAAINPKEKPILEVAAAGSSAPKLDGKLNDPIWQTARANFRFLSIGGGDAPYLGIPCVDTAVQACYDNNNLYLALRMADPDVKALRKVAAPQNPVEVLRKYDDTMVIFINAENQRVRQFAVNAGGVKYYATSGEWGVTGDDLRGVEWAAVVGIAGGMWIVEAAIPFAALEVAPPKKGEKWRANFIRRFREFLIPESYWARISRGWADVNCYGELVFQ